MPHLSQIGFECGTLKAVLIKKIKLHFQSEKSKKSKLKKKGSGKEKESSKEEKKSKKKKATRRSSATAGPEGRDELEEFLNSNDSAYEAF